MTNPPTDTPEQRVDGRVCHRCHQYKPLEELVRSKTVPCGRLALCLPCNSERSRAAYQRYKGKILERNDAYRKSNWDKVKEASYAYQKKDPLKSKARKAVNNAVAAGKFFSKLCSECSELKTDFHHTNGYDEDNWFTGVWLCRPCHAKLHKEIRKRQRQAQVIERVFGEESHGISNN